MITISISTLRNILILYEERIRIKPPVTDRRAYNNWRRLYNDYKRLKKYEVRRIQKATTKAKTETEEY